MKRSDNSELSADARPLPRTVEDLTALEWKDFEAFATSTIQRYYADFDIKVVSTAPSHDDGHDGEAEYVLAKEPGDIPLERSLAIVYRIWLEVKKRSANVTLDDIGKNLLVADNRDVHKLVVITNRGYGPQVKREFEVFASRRNVSYSLITGEHLLELAHAHPIAILPSEAPDAKTTAAPSYRIAISFAAQPNPIDIQQVDDISVQPGEPVFLIASVERTDNGSPAELHLRIDPLDRRVHVFPYAWPRGKNVGPGERATYVFVIVNAEPQADLTFRAHAMQEDGNIAYAEITWGGRCHITQRMLSSWIPPKRARQLKELTDHTTRWIADGGRFSFALVAYAGVGKSVMLGRLRCTWLAAGVKEIFLQGSQRFRDVGIAATLFRIAFPVSPSRLRKEMLTDVVSWLKDCGLCEGRAETFAHALCRDGFGFQDLPPNELAELCASLARRIAGKGRAVLVAEDLHFFAPSAIELLRGIYLNLETFRDANVAFVCTTRQFTASADSELQAKWWTQLQEFFAATAIRREDLHAFDRDEAEDLLIKSVAALERHHATIVVDQVGTTPLALHEAVAWFRTIDVVAPDAVLGRLVANPDLLDSAVKSDDLKNATTSRIKALKDRYPEWLADLIDGAACVGRYFSFAAVKPDGWKDAAQQRDALAACEELDVFHPAGGGLFAFDHDLIRNAVVEMMSVARQQWIAGALVGRPFFAEKPYLHGALLYQAGDYASAAQVLQHAGRDAMKRFRYGDAMRALLLAFSSIDPERTKKTGALVESDAAIAHVEVRRTLAPPTERTRREVLSLLMTLLHCTGATAVFASDAAEAFLTEASMLARELDDEQRKVELLVISGTRAFERDDLRTAMRAHLEAEEIFARRGGDPIDRARNLLRLGITQRQQNAMTDALTTFRRARRLAGSENHDFGISIAMNIGAIYLNDDLPRTARYWRAGLRMAERAEVPRWRVHARIDVGYLELLLRQDDAARRHLVEGYDMAKELELENSIMRAASNLGCLHLVRGEIRRAIELLTEAEEIGIRLKIGRRLWRVRANLATAREAEGNLELAYGHDARVLDSLTGLDDIFNEGRRQWLPVMNIALRARSNPSHRALFDRLDRKIRKQVEDAVKAAFDTARRPPKEALHAALRTVEGRPRFLVTE